MAVKTKDMPIEERIRKHYQAETGEWLIERGKTKEAALLKEACHELERLRKLATNLETRNWNLVNEKIDERRDIEKPFREEISKLEKSNKRYQDLLTKIGSEITWAIKV
jgi:adenosyl cobinamide kinase/adenosyl cobinamide phosphate guanylyltransferase